MKLRSVSRIGLLTVLLVSVWLTVQIMAQATGKTKIVLWHSYRGQEKAALEKTVSTFNQSNTKLEISLLAVPFDAFPDKITNAIPRDVGPDLFIFGHDRIGDWADSKYIEPLDFWVDDALRGRYLEQTMKPLTYRKQLYGLPMAFKSTVLFYNKSLVQTPPKTSAELIELAKKLTDKAKKQYGLAYNYGDFYQHACWFHGFGAQVFDATGKPALNSPESIKSFQFAQDLRNKYGVLPQEASAVTVTSLFNDGKAAMVISGPWFIGELKAGLNYGVAPLPTMTETGKPAKPFLTSEALLLNAKSKNKEAAFEVMKALTDLPAAQVRLSEGKQTVANAAAYQSVTDPIVKTFRAQLDNTVPMPNTPQMRLVWTPVTNALQAVTVGAASPADTMKKAQAEVEKAIAAAKR